MNGLMDSVASFVRHLIRVRQHLALVSTEQSARTWCRVAPPVTLVSWLSVTRAPAETVDRALLMTEAIHTAVNVQTATQG